MVASCLVVVLAAFIYRDGIEDKNGTEDDKEASTDDAIELKGMKIGVTDVAVYDFVKAIRGSEDDLEMLDKDIDMDGLDLVIYTDDVGNDSWIMKDAGSKDDNSVVYMKLADVTDGGYKDYSSSSLVYAVKVVNSIALEIAQLDLDNSKYYNSNAQAYIEKIEQLITDIQAIVNESNGREVVLGSTDELVRIQAFLNDFSINAIVAEDDKVAVRFNGTLENGYASYLDIMEMNKKILAGELNK